MQRLLSRRVVTGCALGLAVAALAAIGATIGSTEAQTADNPYNLIDPNVISVGTMGDAKPYVFTEADGSFTGFDAELFRDVARRMGFKEEQVVFTGMDFAALLPAVSNGRFDVGVAAIGTTDERKKTVDFSDGYLAGYLSIISADPNLTSNESTAGKRIGVIQGTLQRSMPRRT
jgi:polar amino acid transport system substrate-binding protein